MRPNSIFTFLILISFHLSINAQIIKVDDATAQSFDSKIIAQMSANTITGLSVGVIYGGELVFAKGYGFKNIGLEPFTHYTKSLLASVSKTITGVMAMKMIENGDIGLNDHIENYVIGFDNSNITIRHLLAHQSGIDHYNTCPEGYDGAFNPLLSNTLAIGCGTCMLPPGSGSFYSTQGSMLLGCIIHNVGMSVYGKSYTELYNDWIKVPAGLQTLVPAYDNSDPALAEGFDESGTYIGGNWEDLGWKLPAGGFISNVVDLAEYAIAVMNHTFINSITTDQMFTDQPETGGDEYFPWCDSNDYNNASDYGLSFRVSGSDSTLSARHTGRNTHGYSSLLFLYPNLQAGIVLLCNNDNQADVLNLIRQDLEDDILCPQNRNFTTGINWFQPTIYEADQTITCSAEVLVNGGGGEFILDAGTWIDLKPGFVVKTGRTFQTNLEGCGGTITPY